MKKLILLLFLSKCLYVQGQALDSLLQLEAYTPETSLQKQLNMATTVASGAALTTRETPGILSVITSEDIQNSGARDLTDILRLVPGFDFAQDLDFVIGVAMRGNWAHEGKVLILLDGFQMNEILYQNTVLINHFPVDFIDRIEVIRGPGSAIYGGSAEYGVINIITKSAGSLNGVALAGTAGFHKNAVGRTNGGVMAASHGENLSWDLSAYYGKGILSDGPYQDLYGENDIQNLANGSQADPLNLNLGLKYKGLYFRSMYDQYNVSDSYYDVIFTQFYTSVKYDWQISDRWLVTPQLTFTDQVPWKYRDKATGAYDFQLSAKRASSKVNVSYDISRKANLNFGALYFSDNAVDMLNQQNFNGNNTINIGNYAVFMQGLLKYRLANITAGLRYEKNSRTKGTFVPRLALTKKIENFHFKALYSKAFRTPSIENISLAKDGLIQPEKAQAIEFEFGYQLTPEMLLTVNGFHLSTKDPIVYSYEELAGGDYLDYYQNYKMTGTKGIEAMYTIRKKGWHAALTYSFSRALQGNTVDAYVVPQTDRQYVGMLPQKLTAQGSFTIIEGLTINPSFIFGDNRYAYQSIDSEGSPEITELPSYALVNLFVNYQSPFPHFNIGIGVYDLLNEHPSIPQAYNGDYAPIPGRGREYVVKFNYQINFASHEK